MSEDLQKMGKFDFVGTLLSHGLKIQICSDPCWVYPILTNNLIRHNLSIRKPESTKILVSSF